VLCTALILTLASSVTQAADRVVLFEEGTNTSCGPCASANPIIHNVLEYFDEQVAAVKYHVWWPSASDPFYQHNPQPVRNRIQYYGISGVPDVVVDGSNGPSPSNYNAMVSAINTRLAIPSPLIIECDGTVTGTTIDVDIDVTVETPQAGSNFRLFVALIENYIEYQAANGEDEHYYTFRWFSNNSANPAGEVIDLSTAGTEHFDYTFTFHENVYQVDQMSVVAWVQDYYAADKEVIQAGKAPMRIPYFVMARNVGADRAIGAANEAVSFDGEVENAGYEDDTYDLSISGVPTGWTYSYTTPTGTHSGPSSLPLVAGTVAPISLELDSQGNPGPATVTLDVVSQTVPANAVSIDFEKLNGLQVLLVDDDNGEQRETFIEPSIAATGVTWSTWDLTSGELTATDLQNAASTVIWMCGSGAVVPTLTENDRTALGAFMDAGRGVFLSGCDVAYDLCAGPNSTPASEQWFEDYMHTEYVTNVSFSWIASGISGDPIGNGLQVMPISQSGGNSQGTTDGIAPGPGATICITYLNDDDDAGVRWEGGPYKTVFFAFGVEGLGENHRNTIIERVIDYLAPSTGIEAPQGVAPMVRLAQNVPNPFRPSTSISYELGSFGPVSLEIYDVNGRLVRTLVDSDQQATAHTIEWNGTDDAGHAVASGVYFYRLEAPGVLETRRMVLSR